MRALFASSILGSFAAILLAGSVMAQPCTPHSCVCDPPLTKVCGQIHIGNHTGFRCWCKAAGSDVGGSYGKAEIHKKNVPTTHPTFGGGGMNMRGDVGMRTKQMPEVGVMRR